MLKFFKFILYFIKLLKNLKFKQFNDLKHKKLLNKKNQIINFFDCYLTKYLKISFIFKRQCKNFKTNQFFKL